MVRLKVFQRLLRGALFGGVLLAGLGGPARAGDDGQFPAWRSLRDRVVNMRVGPGEDYALRFIYHRQHLPVKVLRLYQGWYLVEDPEGARGWIMMRFLNKARTGMVRGTQPLEMHAAPGQGAQVLWRLAPGVVGNLLGCQDGWCQFDVDHRVGYVAQGSLFGAGQP